MKKKFAAAIFSVVLLSVSAITILWIKNNELKKELDEYSQYKRFFESFNGIVCHIAPVKAEDINKPLYLEHCVNGTVSSWYVAENSAGLKNGGKIFLLGKCLLLKGNSGQFQHCSLNYIYMDLHRYPKILNFRQPVSPGEYFIKFGNDGLTTDFKQLSQEENGIRLTFTDSEKPQMSETLQKFLIAVQITDHSKQVKNNLNDLEHQAETLKLAMQKFNTGTTGFDSVLKEELRLLDILMADENLNGQTKKSLIKEYWKRLNQLYTLKEAEFNAGILPLEDFRSYQKAVSDFKNANNIK